MNTHVHGVLVTALCAGLALGAAACSTIDESGEIEGGVTGSVKRAPGGNDVEGTVYMNAVKVTKIDRSTMNQDGKVHYTVENVSGAEQEDLSWSVSYVFPKGADDSMEISVASVEETTAEKTLALVKGEQNKRLDAVCGAFADRKAKGLQITGTHLNIASNPPVLPVSRDVSKGEAGTRFSNNRIECVGLSGTAEQLTIEFENVTGTAVSDLEVQLVFPFGTDKSRSRSKWKAIPSMAPGKRARAVVDLTGLDIGDGNCLVKVRDQAF